MSQQLLVSRFFNAPSVKPPTCGPISANSQRCPWCRRWVASQGIKNHKRRHITVNDRIHQQATNFGRVKIRGPLYNPDVSLTRDVIDDFDLGEVDDEATETTADITLDDADDAGADLNDVAVDSADAANTDNVPPLEGGYDLTSPVSSGSKRGASDISGDGDVGKYARQRNLHPDEIVAILDDWYSMKSTHGKKKFCKWAAVTKLDFKSFRRSLNVEDNI